MGGPWGALEAGWTFGLLDNFGVKSYTKENPKKVSKTDPKRPFVQPGTPHRPGDPAGKGRSLKNGGRSPQVVHDLFKRIHFFG
jgi:hypothetical protein